MSNFITEFKKGLEGRNIGLSTGIKPLDKAINGIRKGMYIVLAAPEKVGKCLAKGTKVILYDGSLVNVENIKQGDFLLGIDGKPNKIISLARGNEMMYWIHQSKANSYRVNESHILSIKDKKGIISNLSVLEYLNKSKEFKTYNSYGYKEQAIFEEKDLLIDPYILGVWLGDGHSDCAKITNTDVEIIDYLNKFCKNNFYNLKTKSIITHCISVNKKINIFNNDTGITKNTNSIRNASLLTGIKPEYISRGLVKNSTYINGKYKFTKEVSIPFVKLLRNINVLNNKHIPKEYLTGSIRQRMDLLAGLIDSDGYLGEKKKHYEICQKNKILSEGIVYLANSLGFNTKIKEKIATMKRKDGSIYKCLVYRINIKGNVNDIPVKINRKKAFPILKSNNSKLEIVRDKIDEYYGFTLENQDKRFFLEDFTVTHNTTFLDYSFVISPYLEMIENGKSNVHWKYFSLEIDRVSKEFKFAAFFFHHDYNIFSFDYKGKKVLISPNYLRGLLKDQDGEIIKVLPEHQELLKKIYYNRIIPLFGEYNSKGEKIKDGVIEFIEDKSESNPTGIYKYLMNYAAKNGNFVKESFSSKDENGNSITKKRIIGYKENDENLHTIVIVDHMRKLQKERGFSMKENIDKFSEFCVILRNLCKFTIVSVVHSNRNVASIDRLKYNGEFLYITSEDLKDSGNPPEDCSLLLTMFNANDDKYNLEKHFGLQLKGSDGNELYPNYRSIHVATSRDTECPMHIQTNMYGNINKFTSINTKLE